MMRGLRCRWELRKGVHVISPSSLADNVSHLLHVTCCTLLIARHLLRVTCCTSLLRSITRRQVVQHVRGLASPKEAEASEKDT